ncbi:hypothetical protein E8E12_000513 [Didymella heteroderae]|uniref:Heterokaryon incompatibility domain-containing protein n=1 Tax=Didymella heteroderae TaxID=1769908 RepID=A0A9P4WJX9_9PLEO|nr:hypothetical protein E8E12_000513 [Didymella heteroderae]
MDGYRIAIGLMPKEKWPGSMSKAGELALFREPGEGRDIPPLFSGRMIDPNRVNVGLVKKWLEICTERHGDECKVPAYDKDTAVPDNKPRNLLVIDVQTLRLCPLPEESTSYVALSYCWPQGAESRFQTTKAVYKELIQPNGLQSRLGDLTPVVRDAISFVREIGQQFLWVDALCIIQDDLEYKMDQIKQMDLVYGAALMTIMCAEPVSWSQDGKARELQPVEELYPEGGLPGYLGEAEWFIDNRKSAWRLEIPVMNETTKEKWGDRSSKIGAGPIPSTLEMRLQPRNMLKLEDSVWDWSNHLAAWTTQAQFRITGDSYDLGAYGGINFDECENFIIFDFEGHEVGSIVLRWETMMHLLNEGEIHDFILLSRSFEVGAQVTRKLKFFDENMYPPRDWCYLSVMLIGEGLMRGTGSAARFGVGVIHEDAWVAAKPRKNFISLQ